MSNATLAGSTGAISDAAMQPMAKATIVHTLHTAVAAGMLSEFGQPITDGNKVQTLHTWAVDGLTPAEFDSCLTDALGAAKTADNAAGFKPAADAKGKGKYGPRQSTLASRASEMRQVFGCLRLYPDALVKPGPNGLINPDTYPAFARAFAIARDTLKAEGVTWEGVQVETLKQGKATAQAAETATAIKARAQSNNPMKAGETLGDYATRLASMDAEGEARKQLENEGVQQLARKLADTMLEKHDATIVRAILTAALTLVPAPKAQA